MSFFFVAFEVAYLYDESMLLTSDSLFSAMLSLQLFLEASIADILTQWTYLSSDPGAYLTVAISFPFPSADFLSSSNPLPFGGKSEIKTCP